MKEKMEWSGMITAVQPRIRLNRSFDQPSHTYLGDTAAIRRNTAEWDLLASAGFYPIVSMFMNVDRLPMANANQKPELADHLAGLQVQHQTSGNHWEEVVKSLDPGTLQEACYRDLTGGPSNLRRTEIAIFLVAARDNRLLITGVEPRLPTGELSWV
jgi:hypothetical protein